MSGTAIIFSASSKKPFDNPKKPVQRTRMLLVKEDDIRRTNPSQQISIVNHYTGFGRGISDAI